MADIDDGLDEAFKGFGEEPATPPAVDGGTPATPPAATPPVLPKPAEEPKKDDKAPAVELSKTEEVTPPPATPAKKPEEGAESPKAPETPVTPEESKPLTKEDVTSIINNIRTDERSSGKELESTTNEVLEAYYPNGLSNVLVDQKSGKELRTPQDVIDASGGDMDMEKATQWLMNEQFKLDQNVSAIKKEAEKIADTTINFKRDSIAVLQKYDPLFKAYPQLQKKAFDLMMKQVEDDKEKGVILKAPDVLDLYDTYLEPYQQAFEFANGQSATNPPAPAPGTPAAPAAPGADDRLDEGGDGGATPTNDPNDFAQQVGKELAKGM